MVEVKLKDGRTQVITVQNIERDETAVHLAEYRDGQFVREELASGK
jgi:hypothetical protein